ncbi:hypothetical protein NC651_004751 [Populus alba x Populus x berolinensis]|nr:hypothetical protein NC651_004751 [Populus alba x Populus x berolinensis]
MPAPKAIISRAHIVGLGRERTISRRLVPSSADEHADGSSSLSYLPSVPYFFNPEFVD